MYNKDSKRIIRVSVDIFLQESSNLHSWCQDDKEKLIKVGLDWTIVDKLPGLIQKCTHMESEWKSLKLGKHPIREEYIRLMKEAREVHEELYRTYLFVFEDDKDQMEKLKTPNFSGYVKIIELPNNLLAFCHLGKTKKEELKKVNFDSALLDKTEDLVKKLRNTMADYDLKYRPDLGIVRKKRDKAYAHLSDAISIIRKYGKFVFAKNKERLVGYKSDYQRKRRLRLKRRMKGEVVVEGE